MPTLEIISIGAPYSNGWGDYEHLKYVAFPRLISERGIFQDDLNRLQGVLVRLGKRISENGCNIDDSYELIDTKQVDRDIANSQCAHTLRFFPEVAADVKQIVRTALARSPVRQAIFLSDYQLAGDKKLDAELSQARFEDLLLGGQLIFNTKYLVTIKA
jgi:hypothetical protein